MRAHQLLLLFSYNVYVLSESRSNNVEHVKWNGSSCIPNICGGADLDTLQPILKNIPRNLIESRYLYDQRRTLHCLSNKYITVLGDSSTTETVYDLYHILAGAYSNRNVLNSTMAEAAKIKHLQHISLAAFKISEQDPEVQVHFHGTNHQHTRNATIIVPAWNITIRFRWAGHSSLAGNGGGLMSLLTEGGNNDMKNELDCLFGMRNCPSPDIFILQSGPHETIRSDESFRKYLRMMFARMRQLADSKHTKLYFKGTAAPLFRAAVATEEQRNTTTEAGRNMWIREVQNLNRIAEMEAERFNIRFVDATAEAIHLEKFVDLSKYYRNWPHIGGYDFTGGELFFSLYLTQQLIRELCR